MNAKHISLAFVATATLMAGCSKSPIEDVKPSEQLVDLELASVSSTETKAAIDGTDFPQTGEIGLFLFEDETAIKAYGTGYENIKYSYNSDKKKWTAGPSIKVGSTPGYLYGYYPYKESNTNVKAIPVSSSLNGDDVMYAAKQAEPITDKTAANTAITMNHALARVSITVKNNGYTGKALLTSIKFEGAKIARSGTLDATSGNITASKADDVTLSVPEAAQPIATGNGTTYECLLVPSDKVSGPQDVTLTLTIDGEAKSATLSGNDNGVIIAQGTKSNITLTLSNTGIVVSSVSIDDWKEVEVGGHKVKIKLAEEQNIENDVLMMSNIDGNVVKIEAITKSGKALGYAITGKATCNRTKTNNIYAFAISGISSDVTVEIGYNVAVEELNLDRTSVNPAQGWTVYLLPAVSPADATTKGVTWSSDNPDVASVDTKGIVTAVAQGKATITATANDGSGVSSNCTVTVGPAIPGSLSHEFSISATRKVHFSKGNLWAEFNSDVVHFESNQWDYTASTKYQSNHVSHYRWADSIHDAIRNGDSCEHIFCDVNHKQTVDGSDDVFYVLDIHEWEYLINKNKDNNIRKDKYAIGVTVCGSGNCLILAPDDWDTSANPLQASYDATSWESAENAGLVCIPGAGHRFDNAWIENAGEGGYYWSSFSKNDKTAADMQFFNDGDGVRFIYEDHKWAERCLRLVTDSK